MQGWHLTAELYDCVARSADGADLMRDLNALQSLCRHSVHASGLHAVGELFHPFAAPGGITGVVLLAESHVAVHTWPERCAVTLDVYVCNYSADNSAAAQALLDALIGAFAPARQACQRWPRGGVDESR
jgi:S-adenosylmethionine decarboxylase